ncbi:MAG: response regulator [Prevotella sp.]|nr:response regulator [Prevotella sp.]
MRLIILLSIAISNLIAKAADIDFSNAMPIKIYAFDSDESGRLLIDHRGLMWIGSSCGLISYDGYNFKTIKSDAYSPGILPNNVIMSLTEDHEDNIWIGTRDGIVRMNTRYRTFKTYRLPNANQRIIYTIFISKDGRVWVGTDGGLSVYDKQGDTFRNFYADFGYSVKSITEDRHGNLLLGTWNSGLLRFSPKTEKFAHYPRLNPMNSAYSLFLDRRNRLWIGTWDHGIAMIDNPDNIRHPSIHYYNNNGKDFRIVYKIIEDPVTNTVWACSRNGISVFDNNNPEAGFANYPQYKFCGDMVTDGKGHIYVATVDNGILRFNTNLQPYDMKPIDKSGFDQPLNGIESIYSADGRHFWLGIKPCGIALHDIVTGKTLYNGDIPGLSGNPHMENVFKALVPSFAKSKGGGNMWLASSSFGVVMVKDGKPHVLNHTNTPAITDDYVNKVFCDRNDNVWIGQRTGAGVICGNKSVALDVKADVRDISQDHAGNIWLATENEGIIRVSGNPLHPKSLAYKRYNSAEGNIPVNDISDCYEDSHHRLWAISPSGILLRYDDDDRFVAVNRDYHIMVNRLFAIVEDLSGALWLSSDNSVLRLSFGNSVNSAKPQLRIFSTQDAKGNRVASLSDIFRHGDHFYVGSKSGMIVFNPCKILSTPIYSNTLTITDIFIDDSPLSSLDSAFSASISKETPAFTREITIPASVKKFAVEFSLLSYFQQEQNRYAYRLDGYGDWHYLQPGQHRATFENLPSGTYRLMVRAADSFGNIQKLPYHIEIRVLPPWYFTWWAWMLYSIAVVAAIYAGIRWYKELLKTRNRLQMAVIFTNITHELLTPLTVISAVVDDMRNKEPKFQGEYSLINSNIKKITRLLRQILEVRKSQAGQLHLKVSCQDLKIFMETTVMNIRPMADAKDIRLDLNVADADPVHSAWFDTDKLDKIMYNLISNAIKYGRKGGFVRVNVRCDNQRAIITVEDNGIGMSKAQLKKLYTRFLDGDYRKMKTTGTGIGLSLTRDLTLLHHGTIDCQSHEGKGTTFTVTLPIEKQAFASQEIDTSDMSKRQPTADVLIDTITGMSLTPNNDDNNIHRVLIVEDNEELLTLMERLLCRKYYVLTAKNGKQALNIIHKEELDIVISDVMMPVMDGIELIRTIKNDANYAQLPVIMLTAKTRDEDRNVALRSGADDYITKPFRMSDLAVRVDNIIANRYRVRTKFAKQTDFKVEEQHYSDPDQAFVEKAMECVRKHLADGDYDRETFAADMCISSSTLYNKLRAITGQNVSGFISSIRLKEACRILRERPDIPIVELSSLVGFNTPKYFSKCFKKEFGMLPSEYAASKG